MAAEFKKSKMSLKKGKGKASSTSGKTKIVVSHVRVTSPSLNYIGLQMHNVPTIIGEMTGKDNHSKENTENSQKLGKIERSKDRFVEVTAEKMAEIDRIVDLHKIGKSQTSGALTYKESIEFFEGIRDSAKKDCEQTSRKFTID